MANIKDDITKRAEKLKSVRERVKEIKSNPDTMEVICAHVASNGTLVELCEIWDVSYGKICTWIDADDDRQEQYKRAIMHRNEYSVERLLQELRSMIDVDIRQAFDENGRLLPIHKMPTAISKAIHSFDVENPVGEGKHSGTSKIKLHDKLKAIDSLGRDLGRFKNNVEVSGSVKFEDLVGSSMPEHLKPPQYRSSNDDDSKE